MLDPISYLLSLEQFGIKFGLDNIAALLGRLGHPERAFTAVHIAGTNGKGSVTAMVDAALRAAGHRSARYTSPHLIDLSERFVIDGTPVSQQTLVAAVADLQRTAEALVKDGTLTAPPTFFEVTTATAFELFRRAGVSVAAIEVGLGGRLAVPRTAVAHGLERPDWPGRLERRVLSGGREVLLDAAHNPAGAAALASYLTAQAGGPRPLVFGAMRDKDASGMFAALLPAV